LIVFQVSPGLRLETERGRGLVAAVHHAILTTDVSRAHTIHDADRRPIRLVQQILIGAVVAVVIR